MFLMDTAEMERLKDTLFRSSARTDETFHILKSLREEMLTDINLSLYDTAGDIDADLTAAVNTLLQIRETLHDLGCVVMDATDLCESSERSKTSIITG